MAPSSTSKKRPHSPSPSSDPPLNKPRVCRYITGFEKTSKSDVVLESSSDGFHLATRKAYLLASLVFEDTLLAGTDDSSEKLDGLPLIVLEDGFMEIQCFLCFLHPSLPLDPPAIDAVAPLHKLLQFCDKYEAPLVGEAIVRFYFPFLFDECDDHLEGNGLEDDGSTSILIDVFALAMIHLRFGTMRFVQQAIRRVGVDQVFSHSILTSTSEYDLNGRPTTEREKKRDAFWSSRCGGVVVDEAGC